MLLLHIEMLSEVKKKKLIYDVVVLNITDE